MKTKTKEIKEMPWVKVKVNEPFNLTPNQYDVLKELAHLEGESVSEKIRWYVIKGVECELDHILGGGPVGEAISRRLARKWGPETGG